MQIPLITYGSDLHGIFQLIASIFRKIFIVTRRGILQIPIPRRANTLKINLKSKNRDAVLNVNNLFLCLK